jgi:hypothetical protein
MLELKIEFVAEAGYFGCFAAWATERSDYGSSSTSPGPSAV